MKFFHYSIFLIFLIITQLLFARELVSGVDVQLQWQGIQQWTLPQGSRKVLQFSDAKYPTENLLPVFSQRLSADNANNYSVELTNQVFEPLTVAEAALIPEGSVIQQQPFARLQTKTERGAAFVEVQISPFVLRNGKLERLSSFTMELYKTPRPQKIKPDITHTYAANSVLASGKFVKIGIEKTGIYRLTYEDLNSMGISPANVRIFGYGGELLSQDFSKPMMDDLPEIAIHMEKGSDGVFSAGDYILFYAKGVQNWSYDSAREMYTHTVNTYSKKGYYFITSDVGVGRKIETQTITVPSDVTIVPVEEFTDYAVQDIDVFNLASSGKDFYGEKFNEKNTNSYVFNFPNIAFSNTTKVRLDVAALASDISSFSLSLDNAQTKTVYISKRTEGDYYEKGKGANAFFTFTPTRDVLNFKLTYNQPNAAAEGFFNYLEMNVQRALKMSGASVQFQYAGALDAGAYCQYKISDAGSNIQLWDVTKAHNAYRIQTQTVDGKLSFTAPADVNSVYLAIDPTQGAAFPKPEVIGAVANQNIHALPQAEMIVISNPRFLEQAERLAVAHREMDNLRVNVLSTEQIYNEFSSGMPDATAYRKAMKMFYDRAKAASKIEDLPKYLLLFGRGTFDNRKLLPSTGDNLILTYQAENSLVETMSYVTDDYYGFLDNDEGVQVPSDLVDVGIGRFPVVTADQAKVVVDKTIAYMKNTNLGKWKNQLCFLADDGDNALHMKQADSITNVLSRTFPDYHISKIYLDAYNQEISANGESYPVARKQLHDAIAKGMLYLNYTGHAGAQGWANEQVLTTSDVNGLSNKILPLWFGATCNFLQYDNRTVSAGENVVLNPNGGGIGIISAARPVYASQNFNVNKYFTENLFRKVNGEHLRIGDVLALAKNSVGSEINKLSYVYMGDPALKLHFPTDYGVKTTSINGNSGIAADTLKAMGVVRVTGEIIDKQNQQKVSTYNGTVWVDVLDKALRITTQNNHNDGNMTYTDRPNVLYSGKADVVNGAFSYTFMLPKDIKYTYGSGRISYYAASSVEGDESQGIFDNFIVGGTNKNAVFETVGPGIELFLNSTTFKDGDNVNETPVLIANITDHSGINKVGSGIGHDLLITIDNDPSQSYVVNDYFETKANSYTEGSLHYKLPTLANGKHTLTFKAWDLMNNSSVKTIEFEVVEGLQPVIFKIYNYPNPVVSGTQIVVEHDRPETVLDSKIEIFDLSGRRIWMFEQSNTDNVQWDLRAADGVKVKPGIYLYRVSISTMNSEVYSKTNKLLVVE